MNKSDLIDGMAADAGITKAAAKKALESFLGNVEKSLNKFINFIINDNLKVCYNIVKRKDKESILKRTPIV